MPDNTIEFNAQEWNAIKNKAKVKNGNPKTLRHLFYSLDRLLSRETGKLSEQKTVAMMKMLNILGSLVGSETPVGETKPVMWVDIGERYGCRKTYMKITTKSSSIIITSRSDGTGSITQRSKS